MNKKLTLLGVIVAVVVFGAVGWLKSYTGTAVNVIENVENFYSNVSEQAVEVADEAALGIVEFFSGKVTYNQLAPNVLQERIVEMSAGQLASIAWAPVTLLPDPGDGFTYELVKVIGYRKFASEGFAFRDENSESLEIKWADVTTASGYDGAKSLGASLAQGFFNGDGDSSLASPSVIIWEPSGQFTVGVNNTAAGSTSIAFEAPYFATRSTSIVLTGSTSFDATTRIAVQDNENQTKFFFRVIYRLINVNF